MIPWSPRVWCMALSLSATAAGAQEAACVEGDDTLVAESARASLQIESRKQGVALEWHLGPDGGPCPANQPVLALALGDQATLRQSGVDPIVYPLDPADPTAARSLARQVVRALSAVPAPVPLLAVDAPITLGEPPPAPVVEPTPTTPQWQARLGLAWTRVGPEQTLSGLAASAGHRWAGELLELEVSGAWAWGPTSEELAGERLRGGEGLGHLRVGGNLGPVRLTGGLGAGLAWRSRPTLDLDDPLTEDEDALRDEEARERDEEELELGERAWLPVTAGVWTPEVALMIALGPTVEAGASVGPRFYVADQVDGVDLLRNTPMVRVMLGVRR